jgi:signal transduction histidine kinase
MSGDRVRTLTLVRTVRTCAARHPLLVDALYAVLLAGFLARVTAELGTVSGGDWVWLAALHLPLVWRRRQPVTVFWTVVAIAFAGVNLGAAGPALLVVPTIAGYTVARHRSRRALWPMAVPVAAFVAGWARHGTLSDALALAAGYAVAVLLGVNLQTRQAHLAELGERARQLERARIAREMHDIVAHNLAVIVTLADGAVAATPGAPQRGVDLMRKTSTTARQALTDIRRLVGLLREPEGDHPPSMPQPGLDDLDDLVGQVRAAGLDVTLTRTGVPGSWGPGAELAIYRIIQEALTNTIKHAGPCARAEVRLRCAATSADVEIVDDGGDRPATARPGAGHGLTGMVERAAPYGGTVEAGPDPERGWRVHASLSLDSLDESRPG